MTAMAESSRKRWTAQEDERLRELAASTHAEIAEKLNRSESAAEARAYLLRTMLGRFRVRRRRGLSKWG